MLGWLSMIEWLVDFVRVSEGFCLAPSNGPRSHPSGHYYEPNIVSTRIYLQ